MTSVQNYLKVTVFLCTTILVSAQEQATCYGGGSIAASVIITILVILILVGAGYYAWKRYKKYKKGQHLILETDPEKGSEYVFDNPGFKDTSVTPVGKELDKSKVESSTNKAKWTNWSTLSALTSKNEKRKTQDDSVLNEDAVKVVSLRSHDFTGLGFNICGNMRDGIYIKDVLHRGPASESGKLNPGDRITSITINFENMVFDDALTILSYASPYEVIIEARSAKLTSSQANTSGQPGHPIYKSSSSTDLLHIGKSAKKRLFQAEDINDTVGSNYSSLQKSRSTATTLERSQQDSPKKPSSNKKAPPKTVMNPDQLKNQLEQKILEDHNENLKNKQNYERFASKTDLEVQRTDSNKIQKFGIKVLPMEQQKEQKSPKTAELSQNDNNINIELNGDMGVDEVDKKQAPPVKKREKKTPETEAVTTPEVVPEVDTFVRKGSLNNSGIKRDANGIPQEIPNHMMNAAVAARRNRKTVEEKVENTPKKQKGKAPAPPEGLKPEDEDKINVTLNFDEIYPVNKDVKKAQEIMESPPTPEVKTELKDYNSDSDVETDNQSSVNTIELNSSDITIHQTEENDEKQNRRTASTGDLTKIQKNRKTSTGTLERAQSLDITDTGMSVISKKRKGGKLEENFDSKTSSNDSLYGSALINKEPRLSLILDGLNTFQRSRLKKSTEWGNLEDAVLNLNKSDSLENYETGERMDFDSSSEKNFNFDSKSPEFDALVNKINEIKQETSKKIEEHEKQLKDEFGEFEKVKNSLHETIDTLTKSPDLNRNKLDIGFDLENASKPDDEIITILQTEKNQEEDSSFVSDVLNAVSSLQKPPKDGASSHVIVNKPSLTSDSHKKVINPVSASLDMLRSEREFSTNDYYDHKMEDTNVPDDIKVSRHSLGSLERPKFEKIRPKSNVNDNISNVSVSDQYVSDRKSVPNYEIYNRSLNVSKDENTSNVSELYKTALDETLKNDDEKSNMSFGKVLVSTPDLIKNVTIAEAIHDLNNEVTIEGPTSLTFEIPAKTETIETQMTSTNIPLSIHCEDVQIRTLSNGNVKNKDNIAVKPPEAKSSLTYITEIQVLTPNSNKNVSEIEIVPNSKNLDNEFENYVKNFEIKSSDVKSNLTENVQDFKLQRQKSIPDKIDAEKELSKIQEIAEEQLKKLPEMRFTTSSYEPSKIPEKRQSQIELLRSNFEKSPPKPKPEVPPIKSRIPIATSKTPPTSPERRDSRNLDFEVDKDIIEIMTSGIHSTPKYQPKNTSRNVTVTSIRNSKIPSGLPTYGNRPPVPPRKSESSPEGGSVIQVSANGNSESNSFKQWVFNPSDNTVTNITVTDNKAEK